MSSFILNYCIKAKPKSILIKEVPVVCYSENEKTTFPLKHMQILLTILRKVTHSYKNHQTCQRALRFLYAPFDLSTVNTLLIYRFYTGEKLFALLSVSHMKCLLMQRVFYSLFRILQYVCM